MEEVIFIDTRSHDLTTTPTEKLDAVLMYLEKKKDERSCFYGYRMPLSYITSKRIILNERERGKVLEKLYKDGYIDMYMQGAEGVNQNVAHYGINFNGEVFLQNGGYTQQKINEDNRLSEQETDNIISKRNNKILAYGSIALAFIELVKLIIDHHNWLRTLFGC